MGPGVVEALQVSAKAKRASEPNERSWHWGPSGSLVILTQVTTSFSQSGALSLGSELPGVIGPRRFDVRDIEGNDFGQIAFSDSHDFIWGWGRFLRANSLKVGETVRADLDLGTGVALLSVHPA